MKQLLKGCRRSEISVTPKNWATKRASMAVDWCIHYRFYDGERMKQVRIRRMNEKKTLEERQKRTRLLLENETELLDRQGLNPITGKFMVSEHAGIVRQVMPDTPFIEALREGRKKLDCVPDTLVDVDCVIAGIEKAAEKLYDIAQARRYADLPISSVGPRHIKLLLDQCALDNTRWSNNRFNKYKAYLSMIYRELAQLEAVDMNPTKVIYAKKRTTKISVVLTIEEQKKIDEKLKAKHYRLWRYMRIFFRSGSRTTEMLSLRKNEKINLPAQEFIVMVKKGKVCREDLRPIPADILPLWQELWDEAKPGQYLFSHFLKPGDRKIRKDQPGRYWKKYVRDAKTGLGINVGFYKLKHLHTDMLEHQIDMEHAMAADGHTNERTTSIYAVGAKRRKIERLKKETVKFAG